MKLVALEKKLIAAARLQQPDDRVPYAFEKRIMAQLAARSAAARQTFWTHGLWRAAISCLALTLIFGALSWYSPVVNDDMSERSQDFETTLLASIDQPEASSATP
jgi:hypothetical protein